MTKKTKSTEQLNLRISKELIEDLDMISRILKVSKSEWIKIKIGELAHTEKTRLMTEYAGLKNKGVMDKKDIDKLIK